MELPTPMVLKRIDGNPSELSRLENNPGLDEHLFHTEEGCEYQIKNDDGSVIDFYPINTPGHLSDHLIFLVKSKNKWSLFSGDSIVGANSTFFMDYPQYFASLLKTRDLIIKHDIETLYVAHSLTLRTESIALPALKKCEDYIKRRTSRDKQLEKIAFLLARGNLGKFDLNTFYDF
jgi:glyoxylase-like metal-dependent hydrolase (beta-lactamase superfamily II)